jgi:hypothetical protein
MLYNSANTAFLILGQYFTCYFQLKQTPIKTTIEFSLIYINIMERKNVLVILI